MEDKTELLYNSLFESGDYTKSFEEFQAQFSTEENVGLLYSSLNKSGLYTKTPQEFSEQFFPNIGLKKKRRAYGIYFGRWFFGLVRRSS